MAMKKTWMLGLVWGLAACSGGSSPSSEASSGGDAAQYEGPIASTDVQRGEEQFELYCADCHPDGEEDVGPSLIADPHPPATLRRQIREGSGKMRPFSENRLSDEDLEAILAYMNTLGAVSQ